MEPEIPSPEDLARPIPLIPIERAVLLPGSMLALSIDSSLSSLFEDVSDGAGLLALAVSIAEASENPLQPLTPLRPAVCIGQVVQQEAGEDGAIDVLIRGVWRGRIVRESLDSAERGYRSALVRAAPEPDTDVPSEAKPRRQLATLLSKPPLSDLREASKISGLASDPDISLGLLVDLITQNYVASPAVWYEVLEEFDVPTRVQIVGRELEGLAVLLKKAAPQRLVETPRGCHWN